MKKSPPIECQPEKFRIFADFVFDAKTDEIPRVVERVMCLAREMNCAPGKEFEIEIALREALVNAIIHGSRRDPSKKIQCCVACDEAHGILLVVRDSGKGFNPKSLPNPLKGKNLFSSHGRGIYLINQLMDEVTFKRGGSEIHMRKR